MYSFSSRGMATLYLNNITWMCCNHIFKMYPLQVKKLHGCKEKHLKLVNILKCLTLAKKNLQGCKVNHSKHVKTRESSLLAKNTWLFLKV